MRSQSRVASAIRFRSVVWRDGWAASRRHRSAVCRIPRRRRMKIAFRRAVGIYILRTRIARQCILKTGHPQPARTLRWASSDHLNQETADQPNWKTAITRMATITAATAEARIANSTGLYILVGILLILTPGKSAAALLSVSSKLTVS